MNIYDILNSSCSSDGELGAGNEMENMDITLNYENPELMSSEFFDSVFSLEQEGLSLKPDDGLLSVFDDEMNLSSESSSHIDEVFSPQSFSSESDKNSILTECNDDMALGQLDTIDNISDIMSFLEPVHPVKSESQVTTTSTVVTSTLQKPHQIPKQPTKIVIQNPNNKKIFVTKPLMHATQLHKRTGNSKSKQQILRVQSLAGNGRSVLLPINVKSIKILNPNDIKKETIQVATPLQNHLKRRKVQTQSVSSSLSSSESVEEDDTDVVSSTESQYPALHLTNEEKRLLAKEGIHLPAHYPLTKNEERELKRIRRKIRNKISAQDSRKRKKEYVDGLEERVKRGSEENKFLLQRIKQLQKQNSKLMAHLSKLQSMIFSSTTSKAAPTTCLMIVLLSALLVSLPNIRLPQNKEMATEQEQVAIRRALLSSQQATEDDTLNMDEFLVFNKDDEEFDGKLSEDFIDIENITDKDFSKLLEEMGSKYGNLKVDKNCSEKESLFNKLINNVKKFLNKHSPDLLGNSDSGGGYYNNKGFIEPDIDDVLLEKNNVMIDDDPPSKRMKYNSEEYYKFAQINENVVPVLKDATQFNSNTVSATVKSNTFAITSSKDK